MLWLRLKTMESVFCVLTIVQRKQLLSELARPRWRLTDKLGWVVTTWWYWAIFGWEIEKKKAAMDRAGKICRPKWTKE
jgi:hypothetical protein